MNNLKFYLKSALLATTFGAFTLTPKAMEKDEEENNNNKSLPLSSFPAPVQKVEENLQDKSFDSWFLRNNGTNLSSSSSQNFGSNQTPCHYVDSTDNYLSSVSKNYTRNFDSVVRIGSSPPPSPPPLLSGLHLLSDLHMNNKILLRENYFQSFDEAMFWKIIPITIDYLKQPSSIKFIGIEGLPKEMMVHILSFFTAPELNRFSTVSKVYREIIDFNPSLQKILFNYFFEKKKSAEPTMIETRAFIHFISARYGFYGEDIVKEISDDAKSIFPKRLKRLDLESFKLPEYQLDLESLFIRIASTDQVAKGDDQTESTASTDQIENDDHAEKTDDTNLNDKKISIDFFLESNIL